jgi:hypothetical protein
MSKIQTILGLFLFLVILFSMDMIFGYPLRETFGGGGGGGGGGRGGGRIGIAGGANVGLGNGLGVGRALDYIPAIRANRLNGNLIYSGQGYLGATAPYYEGDDQPLFFGFSN